MNFDECDHTRIDIVDNKQMGLAYASTSTCRDCGATQDYSEGCHGEWQAPHWFSPKPIEKKCQHSYTHTIDDDEGTERHHCDIGKPDRVYTAWLDTEEEKVAHLAEERAKTFTTTCHHCGAQQYFANGNWSDWVSSEQKRKSFKKKYEELLGLAQSFVRAMRSDPLSPGLPVFLGGDALVPYYALENAVKEKPQVSPEVCPSCKKCDVVQNAIQTWLDQKGHDSCHYYPQIFQLIAKLFNLTRSADLGLPTITAFRNGCRRYTEEIYGCNTVPLNDWCLDWRIKTERDCTDEYQSSVVDAKGKEMLVPGYYGDEHLEFVVKAVNYYNYMKHLLLAVLEECNDDDSLMDQLFALKKELKDEHCLRPSDMVLWGVEKNEYRNRVDICGVSDKMPQMETQYKVLCSKCKREWLTNDMLDTMQKACPTCNTMTMIVTKTTDKGKTWENVQLYDGTEPSPYPPIYDRTEPRIIDDQTEPRILDP
jgi:hypothetical protein